MYLWLKALHLFFLVSWFAGLFYLPRIFVNLAMAAQPDERARLLLMAQKLFKFMTPWGVGALLCGLAMPLVSGAWAGWLHGKITLGVLLAGYHIWCGRLLRGFAAGTNRRSHRWFRIFNELPVFILMAAVYLAVFKPF
ncbi:CopD family protein [Conchiformibius kuhniae]|uniref:Protoporphyrinogen IX oxidase n=1 Tax=Conchiformibius kuhniae TaxID=211502 RepID=A0A8T9MTT2_9NEIS|nr:CopD family protein [Conchiformibius kuhniae]UOP04671.1 CopD family protein [Conchiformibius kuhniae]